MYTVRLTKSLIKNIGRVDIDVRSFNPIFVLGEETKEWLNINTIGEWRVVDPYDTRVPSIVLNNPWHPSIVFSHEADCNWFILRFS